MSVAADLGSLVSPARPVPGLRTISVEHALARVDSLVNHPVDSGVWWTTLARGVSDLTDAMWEEGALASGPDGLLQQMVAEQPRLDFQVRRLEREHADLTDALVELRLLLSACMCGEGGIATVLAATAGVVGQIRGHRRRFSTLVHEAYQHDLGGVG